MTTKWHQHQHKFNCKRYVVYTYQYGCSSIHPSFFLEPGRWRYISCFKWQATWAASIVLKPSVAAWSLPLQLHRDMSSRCLSLGGRLERTITNKKGWDWKVQEGGRKVGHLQIGFCFGRGRYIQHFVECSFCFFFFEKGGGAWIEFGPLKNDELVSYNLDNVYVYDI